MKSRNQGAQEASKVVESCIEIDDDLREELNRYDGGGFDLTPFEELLELPPEDELFVSCWAAWARQAREGASADSLYAMLERHLPQLWFPIREGIRAEEEYRQATLRGVERSLLPAATGLVLARPEAVQLEIYPSLAGNVPVLSVRHRGDYESLLRALARRNEPSPVPRSQGALTVGGYNNWTRLNELRQRWEQTPVEQRERPTWGAELAVLRPQTELYKDRFILLSDGPYSGVKAADLGLDEEGWRAMSLTIRREHECTHYFTRRLLGSMRPHLLDELLADYAGLVAALGRFRADWFLRFLGIEDDGESYREGRLGLYRGDPPLSDGAFSLLTRHIAAAARNLERFDATLPTSPRPAVDRAAVLVALAASSLDELADASSVEILARRSRTYRSRISWRDPTAEA